MINIVEESEEKEDDENIGFINFSQGSFIATHNISETFFHYVQPSTKISVHVHPIEPQTVKMNENRRSGTGRKWGMKVKNMVMRCRSWVTDVKKKHFSTLFFNKRYSLLTVAVALCASGFHYRLISFISSY